MKNSVLALALSLLLLLFPGISMVLAQDTTGLAGLKTEQVSLYGYILHYLNLTADDIGNIFYFRLKGDWYPGPNLFFHMELDTDYRTETSTRLFINPIIRFNK